MVFSEPVFLFLFLPACLALHALAPRGGRNLVLLAFSLLFYAWGESIGVLLMLASITWNWTFGLWVARARRRGTGRAPLLVGVAGNLALLVVFKYADLIVGSVAPLLASLGLPAPSPPHLPLPLGISFFTFHEVSYLIDVARGDTEAQARPLDFALYVSLFPQLVAGPIVRYRDIAAQLASRQMQPAGFAAGVRRFVIGLAKKLLVANALGAPADQIFALDPGDLTLAVSWLGAACYTLQIYFDFSGYSDMAIGLGRMFGFTFRENFDHPYVARSVTDFWRRWHLSLSTWFRDYLYIPLGGNRRGAARTYANLVVVFALCGLWHGAQWSFLVWGLYHGAFLVLERRVGVARFERRPVLRHVYAVVVVMVGWVFFRADTLGHALGHLRAMAGLGTGDGRLAFASRYLEPRVVALLLVGVIGSAPVLPWLRSRLAPSLSLSLGAAATVALLIVSVLACAASTYNPFIYYRF